MTVVVPSTIAEETSSMLDLASKNDVTTTSECHTEEHRRRTGSLALRSNLTREQRNRDPLFYYSVEQVLGIGSMGSVVKVRKRIIGGSARPDLRHHFAKEHCLNQCFALPLVGSWFRTCLGQWLEYKPPALVTESLEDFANAEENDTSLLYAMKSIHLSRVTDDSYIAELKNEIQILRSLDHPHIVKAMETFEHRNQLFIVMELCQGGDLYSRDPYTEEEAARIVASVLSAIAYMHSKHLLHRDLKYENILFVSHAAHAEVKLIDFGLSAAFGNDELTDGVGTIYTMAPEVLKGKYTQSADLWSVGVIAYMLLSSQMPFYGKKRRHIVEQIMTGRFEFNGRRWKKVSQQAKEFVKDLLVVNPAERVTADEAMSASWLMRRFGATSRGPSVDELEAAHQSMVQYSKYSRLKQVALMVIAHRSTSDEIGILRKLFQQYDTAGKGHVTYEQFQTVISKAGYTAEELRRVFDALDMDGSGKIRYTEFLASTIEAQGAIDERRLAEAFDRLDSDDSGYITVANLREILGPDFPKEEIEQILKESAKNGKVSYMDFLAQWQDQKESKRQDLMADISNLKSDSSHPGVDLSSEDADESTEGDVLSRVNFIHNKHQVTSSTKISDLTLEGIMAESSPTTDKQAYADV